MNVISFPDARSVISYWRANYYRPEAEHCVAAFFERHFQKCPSYDVEKHIMAVEGCIGERRVV